MTKAYEKIAIIVSSGRMMANTSIEIPIDLPDTKILAVNKTASGDWLIQLESTLKGTKCRQCGRPIEQFHGYDGALRLRHLPLFEVPVWIEFSPKRYRCKHCDGKPTTTQRVSWHEVRSPNTKPYERWLLKILINSTVADVARKLNISAESVTGVLDRWLLAQVNWDDIEQISSIPIDEIALKRGHRDYVVLVTMHSPAGGVAVLAVLPDRQKQTVAHFLSTIPINLRTTIQWVCTDMYQGFVGAAREQLPRAKLVIDRFHVAKAYRSSADTVRKQELKRLKQTLSKTDYEQLKGVMWAFRKSPASLKDDERTGSRAGIQALSQAQTSLCFKRRTDSNI